MNLKDSVFYAFALGGGGLPHYYAFSKGSNTPFYDTTPRNTFLRYFVVYVGFFFFRNINDTDWLLYGNTEHRRLHLIIVLLCYAQENQFRKPNIPRDGHSKDLIPGTCVLCCFFLLLPELS